MNICIWSCVSYSDLRQRPHHMAAEMVKLGHQVLFVENTHKSIINTEILLPIEPNFDLINQIHLTLEKNIFPNIIKTTARSIDGVVVVDIVSSMVSTNGISISTAKPFYRSIMNENKIDVIIVQYPRLVDYLDTDIPVVYDCADLFSGFSGEIGVEEYEQRMIERSNLVVVTSKNLFRLISRQKNNVVLIENGVDLFDFKERIYLGKNKKKVAGFIGAVAEWINLPLLNDVAKIIPKWEIHVVGPRYVETRPFRHIFFHEEIPKGLVGKYLIGFDVGLIPFKKIPLSEYSNPIKYYEYVASGLSVVSTSIEDMIGRRYVTIADTAKDYADAIVGSEPKTQPRLDFINDNSWSKRTKLMVEEIEKII